jgi:3-hydroxyacyl-CoA dehydrogenase/enoyl-CoA hydratase/3-hydroxybutyryl-CoA epimerase
MGPQVFVDLCRKLQAKHGDRFAPPRILIEMAASGGTFYGEAQARKAA